MGVQIVVSSLIFEINSKKSKKIRLARFLDDFFDGASFML